MYTNSKNLGVINYTGNKSKLLPKILPLFPSEGSYTTFIDACAGSLSVAMSINATNILCNDIEKPLVDVYKTLVIKGEEQSFHEILELIECAELGKDIEDKGAYLDLREMYNDERDSIVLLTLLYHSFSNQIRFNKQGDFNTPFGRRTFNPSLQAKLKLFFSWLNHHNVSFSSKHYNQLHVTKDDFLYIDPPYLITDATYNVYWSADEDKSMMQWLDALPCKWAMSNVFAIKGKTNDVLACWAEKYNIHYINGVKYVSGAYHASNTDQPVIEVLITNY